MTGRLGLGLALALAAAACGSAPSSPSPEPTPASTWDPRRDEIDQAEGVWTAEQPDTYAYTSTNFVNGMGGATSRVTGIDGHIEVQERATSAFVNDAGTIEAMFENARAGLAGDGTVTVAVDQRYGFLASLDYHTDVTDGSYTQTVTEFVTPGDKTANARATDALNVLLDRWESVVTPAWAYTWTRVDAAAPATPTGWTVRHADGVSTATAAGSSVDVDPPSEITIDEVVGDAVGVMGRGGWVDVSADDRTGLDVLLAIDPSPGVKGDGYWIRIDFTDRAAASQKELLDAARLRWTRAKVTKATYTWAYDGDRGSWTWSIRANGDTLKFLKRSAGAPAGEAMFVRPSIRDTFDMIDEIIAEGGTVLVTYDKALGYPKKIVVGNGGSWAPKGTITITKFKTR
ncbi:MAG TPA: DUF6174 domain-containing protein [Candidatus Limnocylindrales bacterium]|nr:DUF6174 domain-containing protein [Candidatus Limnocylindrales bacterium]